MNGTFVVGQDIENAPWKVLGTFEHLQHAVMCAKSMDHFITLVSHDVIRPLGNGIRWYPRREPMPEDFFDCRDEPFVWASF